MGRRVLVIGGSGFIGHAVVRRLAAAGDEIWVLNRGSRPLPEATQLTADRDDPAQVAAALDGHAFDLAIDTVCYTPVQVEAILAALDGRTPRYLVISSVAVYTRPTSAPPGEAHPGGGPPIWGDYGRNKAGVEEATSRAAGRFEAVTVVRPPYVFGPGNKHDRERWFWARQLAGRTVLLPGAGDAPVQFIHEDDLAAAIDVLGSAAAAGYQIYNTADAQVLTLSQLATLLAGVAGVEDRQVAAGPAAGDRDPLSWFPFRDYPCLGDPARIMAETSWRPDGSLDDRFKETFEALGADRLRSHPIDTAIEDEILARLGRR
ncbi:MAG: NAD-dependent epimerase/dehydratase family protein [Alphaproteobacteria bacterium]|jgi:nucleoside-diphosphate-sugar epimerase|nr:NAD-dependent epimerase/dehydratase family protein [Alphaproteobacteria bacterium]